ncbi:hypothetical protein EII12_02675 [Buchananella hordeovulneris]|uniref:right-handed parallel beta-helix repeat-containing protein n=1 Tax=Buchananella hordeovulneris TaxID=52770 RepID=UPI000F5F8511|nr:right-handed parallel beta-helix repeat-containing protein [Buchananella hordeovulneris]RRD53186.1 hypothetical protein EII12_02675 [Buchananella hordeovulneris]
MRYRSDVWRGLVAIGGTMGLVAMAGCASPSQEAEVYPAVVVTADPTIGAVGSGKVAPTAQAQSQTADPAQRATAAPVEEGTDPAGQETEAQPAPGVNVPAPVGDAGARDVPSVPAAWSLDEFLAAHHVKQADATVVSSLSEALALTAPQANIVVSDGTAHALFVREATDADKSIEVAGASYGARFEREVPVLAFAEAGHNADAVNAALQVAAQRELGVRLSPKAAYTFDKTVKIPAAVSFLDGAGASIAVQLGGGTQSKPNVAVLVETNTDGLAISNLRLDLSASPFTRGVLGHNVTHLAVTNSHITGVDYRAIEFVATSGPVTDVAIVGNTIEATPGDKDNKGITNAIYITAALAENDPRFTSSSSPIWDRYTTEGDVVPGKFEASRFTVADNHISGGYYGLGMSAIQHSLISGNHIEMNMRNISLQNNCSYNVVENNELRDSISSSVHLAYNSDHNVVRDNNVATSRASGQGLLQAYQGSNDNTFTGNTVSVTGDSQPSWILYVGTDSHNVSFTGNTVNGGARHAVVGIESVWDGQSAVSGLDRNLYTYMSQGTIPSPVDGSAQNFGGGFGPLAGVSVTDNVFAPANPATPLIYVGAEVSKGRHGESKIVGDVTGLVLRGNQVEGDAYSELLITHEGELPGVGRARIQADDDSVE